MSVPLVDRRAPSSMQAATTTRPDTSSDADVAEPLCISRHSHVTLTKEKHYWACARGSRLENSLGWAVGLLEFGNAGDFAANIWNGALPLYAVVFMAVGGTVAGVLCIFAFIDATKAWHNVKFLWNQRQELRKALGRQPEHVKPIISIDTLTTVTTRELRSELISRWGLDLVMGAGAILISAGTFMAIAGESSYAVWLASNILSGYLGNAPLACISVANAVWQAVIWTVMQSHRREARKRLQGSPALAHIKHRCFDVQAYAIVNGLTTTIGAVASMLTVTHWWAYVILIPVIISSFLCNMWWRKRLGYDRSYIDTSVELSIQGLCDALEGIARAKRLVKDSPHTLFEETAPQQVQVAGVLGFLVDHGLFEVFCAKLINDKKMSSVVVSLGATQVEMHAETLPTLLRAHYIDFNRIVMEFLGNEGYMQLTYQERFLAETLGTFLKHN